VQVLLNFIFNFDFFFFLVLSVCVWRKRKVVIDLGRRLDFERGELSEQGLRYELLDHAYGAMSK
jgi:hypothetical protein